MQLDVTKKVRMSRSEAKTLARLARQLKESESHVLREGLQSLLERQERLAAVEELIKLAEGETYTKVPFELK